MLSGVASAAAAQSSLCNTLSAPDTDFQRERQWRAQTQCEIHLKIISYSFRSGGFYLELVKKSRLCKDLYTS